MRRGVARTLAFVAFAAEFVRILFKILFVGGVVRAFNKLGPLSVNEEKLVLPGTITTISALFPIEIITICPLCSLQPCADL